MTEIDEPEFWPSFDQVSEATWDALRACATDTDLMERLFEAMKDAGRFEQWIAGPAIAAALTAEPRAERLDATERVALANLLAAMIGARFELWAIEMMGAESRGDRLVW